MQIWQDKRSIMTSGNLLLIALSMIMSAALIGVPTSRASAQIYYLGVLAPQGETVAQQHWQPWLNTLNSQLTDDTIVLVPLGIENWQAQIQAQQFALVLGPQVQIIKMDTAGWRWLATLKSHTQTIENIETSEFKISAVTQSDFNTDEQYRLYKQLQAELAQNKAHKLVNESSAMEQIASALWVANDSDIQQLQDLKQRKVVAVAPDAFGGYLLIAHLLQQNGVVPSDYGTQFVGFPIDLTLSTLASGAVDAAIAPLCLMEEMSAQGKINQEQYRLIHPEKTASSCQSSTKIYPNWTLAATNQAPAALIEQVNQHLFAAGQPNAVIDDSSVNEIRWLAAESSVDAERILYEMNQHPTQKGLTAHIIEWIKTHRWWMGVIVFIILISTINYAWMSWLAWRRQQQIMSQNRIINNYDQQIRQSERFAVIGEMSGSIAHEINQPLAAIQNYAQGLLIRNQNQLIDTEATKRQSNDKHSNDKQSNDKQLEKQATENALQQIVNETERVAAVINNIRRWAGRTQLDEISVDIAATYQQCIMLLGEKALGISFCFASDYQQLRLPNLLLDQLIINSVLNSQQQGATHIMLRCQAVKYNNEHYLALYITDDAGGFLDERLINAETQDRATHQVHDQYATRSTKADGLGLGLMICQRLCKSLGGKMQLSNVDVQQELSSLTALATHYQLRLKPSLNRQLLLEKTDTIYPISNKTGAQVRLYLPLKVADDDKRNQK